MHILVIALLCSVNLNVGIHAKPEIDPTTINTLVPTTERKLSSTKDTTKDDQLVSFSFVDRNLVDIVNSLAALKEVNIILPQGPEAITQNITYKPTGRDTETLKNAWELLKVFLELSGYSLIARNNMYVIVKNDDRVSREPLPLYINVDPEDIPQSEQRIRYVYYFTNLKVSDPTTVEALTLILNEMLAANKPYIFEPKTNGIIISDKATAISSVMRIIGELDVSGFKETIQVIPLYYATATDVKKIFDDLRLAISPDARNTPFLRGDPKAELSTYFPSGTVIQADPRLNSLIVMGRESAVSRINEFIQQYIDVSLESGTSILHIYDLQYLRASDFAKTLQDIVTRQVTAGDQSRGAAIGAGPEKFFNQVIIKGETVEQVVKAEESPLAQPKLDDDQGLAGTVFTNGNRLVIAANSEDWIRIRNMIDQLDKPQPQVIIEVFIIDFRFLQTRALAGSSRNTLNCNINNDVNYLSSNIGTTDAVLGPNPQTLATDLLRVITNPDSGTTGVAPVIDPGSLLISLNDPCTGIFGLLQILSNQLEAKIISHPYVIALNNQIATIKQEVLRRVRGEAFTSAGGVPTTPIVDITAKLQLQILPRVSSLDRLGLEIAVTIDEFTNADSNNPESGNRITRRIRTNSNLNSGQILALGGLTRHTNAEAETQTPILAQIPFIGRFFGSQRKADDTTTIAVFISPTVVEPKLRGGLNAYTAEKIRESRQDTAENYIFSDFKDPITRFFFRTKNTSDGVIRDYLAHTANAPTLEELKTIRERPRIEPIPSQNIIIDQPQDNTKATKLKELLAKEENPLSTIYQRPIKNVFYS